MNYEAMNNLASVLKREAARDPDHRGLEAMRERCDRVVTFGQQLGVPEATAYGIFIDACHRGQSLDDLEREMVQMAREANGGAQ